MNFMGIFSYLGVKTKVELSLLIIVLVLLALILAVFIVTAVIRETGAVGGCKKVPYGPGHEGRCGNGYFAVSVLDGEGVLRNPEAAPAAGYMVCCRVER
jgi:hypothetical protein